MIWIFETLYGLETVFFLLRVMDTACSVQQDLCNDTVPVSVCPTVCPILCCNRICGGLATIRYDTRCYFNVRSKADMSQLNLYTARNRQLKSVKTEKLKSKKTDMIRSKVNSLGNPYSETWMRKRKGWGREDLQKRKDLSLEWEWVGDGIPIIISMTISMTVGR